MSRPAPLQYKRPMSPEMAKIFFIAVTLWGALVAWKAMTALKKQEPYQFSMWDVGMRRAGKRLNRTGTYIKLFAAIIILGLCVTSLAGLYVTGGSYLLL